MTGQVPVTVPGQDLRPSGWPDRNAAQGPAAIVAAELVKTYPGGVQAVRGISLSVAAGESFGLLGPNGAGKTTTIGMLNTTVRPTSGRALLAGHDVQADPMGARRVSSVVFQDPVVDRPLTGRQNLRLHLRLRRVPKADGLARLAELTEAAGLAHLLDRPVATYSGGERRRLEIVRALLSAPRVLFLDEPTVGLDTRIRHDLFDTIATLRERTRVTVLLTTHYLDEAERLCDRLAIIDGGRIVACDTPARLLTDLAVSGATFGAGEALARGLVDEAVPAEQLAGRSLAAARRPAALGPAFGLTKRQLRQRFLERVHDLAGLDAEVDAIWQAAPTLERIRSFMTSLK
jgi:ABC-2 type transport system ATP-binding protein